MINMQELKFEYLDSCKVALKTPCPYIDAKIGSGRCRECSFNRSVDYTTNIVKCAHPKKVNELFNCSCPYCDSERFEQIQCELDDTRAYMIAKCLDCGKKFDLTYACIKIDKTKED